MLSRLAGDPLTSGVSDKVRGPEEGRIGYRADPAGSEFPQQEASWIFIF